MQSKATSVAAYLKALPDDRREALEAIRKVILKNLDKDLEEGMQYGHIGYYVPHKVFPPGYHCDPTLPLHYAGIASQKNHMALYLMCVYVGQPDESGQTAVLREFREAWKKTGKKLDMGASCVRFKKLEDVPLDVVGALFKKLTVKKYLAAYREVLERGKSTRKKPG
jgi:Domain of unknown function (DU1801)